MTNEQCETAAIHIRRLVDLLDETPTVSQMTACMRFIIARDRRAYLEARNTNPEANHKRNDTEIDQMIRIMDQAAADIDPSASVDHGVGMYSVIRVRGSDIHA